MTAIDATERPCAEPRIAICTALLEELAACRLMIDELVPLNPDNSDDGNQYWCGTLPSRADGERHRVLLTFLVKMGNNVAATAVTHLIRSFPSVEYVLMVGIAGGIPHPTKPDEHVRLGDVVVSNEKGVLQYDNVKSTPDKILIRDNSPKPGAPLIGAAKALASDFVLGLLSLDDSLLKAAHLPAFQRPSPDTDLLHNSRKRPERIPHPTDSWRDQNPGRPKFHLGAIGSANELLKDPIRRDRLRDEHGVRAIEMEGSGTADATWIARRDYLVIRGICDYCDTHKNDEWHNYAALVAAAYARALIGSLPDFPPRHRYDRGSSAPTPTLDAAVDQRSATRGVVTDDIEQLRSALGQFYVERLESILDMRSSGEIDNAWEKLNEELATLAVSAVPEPVQARYFYHAARFAQGDGKPLSQQGKYHQAALRLNPDLDDRTYRAFQAVSEGNIELAIETLRPFDNESVCVNLCRHLLEADRWSDVDKLLGNEDARTTDEVRRMRAICRLADGDFAGAWSMLEPALGRHQEDPLYLLTASYVAFWQAMPPDLHRPGNFGPGLFTTGVFTMDGHRHQRLADSFRFCRKALDLVPANSNNVLRRDARDACIAVGTATPQHHDEAAALAEVALAEDPTAPVPVWALLRMQRGHDWAPTVSALRAICDGPNPQTDHVALLADLLMILDEPKAAWHYLECIESRNGTPDEKGHWFERAIRCLGQLGRLSDLEPKLSDLSDSPEHRRLTAAYWSARNEPEKVREIAEALVNAPGTRLDHVNLVSLHRAQMEWFEVSFSARCCLRKFPDTSAEVIDALATAWLELHQPSEALAVLTDYEAAYVRDGMLDAFFFRTMSAQGALGQYDKAFEASEALWQRRPYADLVSRRAQLQFLLGHIPRAVEILKQGIYDGFETPDNFISVGSLSLSYNPEEAFLWACKAVERYPDDPQVRVSAMYIAFNSGHGDWASIQLAVLTQRSRDSGLFTEASPPMIRKTVLEWQQRFAANWGRFTTGQAPFHIWADASNRRLGTEFYWRWHHNRDRSVAERVPLPISYGGRPARTSLSTWTGRVVIMDFTACLTAHLLKLFPTLDKALDEIFVPPSLFAVIQREIHNLSEEQTDFIERGEELLARLEGGAVTLLPPADVTQGEYLALQLSDRQKWRLAEDHGLRVVTDKFATEMFGEGEIPEALNVLRVPPLFVIDTLRFAGELIGDLSEVTPPQVPIPGNRCDLPRGAKLLVDRALLDELLLIGGYEAATLYFRLYCMDDIRDDIRADILGFRYRQKVKVWLEGLLVELKRRKASGKLKTLSLPRSPVEDYRHQPLTHELRELVSGSEGRAAPVWIDDRTLTSYPGSSGSIQVVGIHDILGILRARDAIAPGKYVECYRDLIQSGMVFRAPAPDYLFGLLHQSKVDLHTGKLIENQPLSRLRQSVAACLYADSCIGTMPLRPGMLAEREHFIMELRRLKDEVMAMIWTKDGLDERRCAAMANWLYDQFFPNDARVAADPRYQGDLVQGLAVEHSARICLCSLFLDRPSAVKAYYRWLFPHLEASWRHQEKLRQKVFDHYAQLIIGTVRDLSRMESSIPWIARFVDPMRFLPPELSTALLDHPKLEPMLRPFFHWGAYIDSLDLFIPDVEWSGIANACMEQSPDVPYIVTVEKRLLTISFRRAHGIGDAFVVLGATATGRQSQQTILYSIRATGSPGSQAAVGVVG